MELEEEMMKSWLEVSNIFIHIKFIGTFANTRLINKLVEETGPYTMHFPS